MERYCIRDGALLSEGPETLAVSLNWPILGNYHRNLKLLTGVPRMRLNMAYQALLFCPEEKTARTVTQVLSELDFEVTACTEPFAAVKKLMAEHFDAVVVDCDNEQNATLLYKSARNAPNNHSALAVAVVEGQAGVAKAFRIGANLVLTKPINVEQAKGTLRVARGLLRKNEGAKTTSPVAASPSKPVASVTAPQKPAPSPTSSAVNRSANLTAMPARVPVEPNQPEPVVVQAPAAAAPDHSPAATPIAPAPSAPSLPATAFEAKPHAGLGKAEAYVPAGSGLSAGSGAASAPAPALEPKPSAKESKPATMATAPAIPETISNEVAGTDETKKEEKIEQPPTPMFSLGGAEADAEPSGGSKKALIAVAAVIVVAAAAYVGWTQ